jgi:DNA repair exonuclease SbcCD ATPase subunit
VRALETENKRLDVHIKEIETVENRERKNLVGSYEKELAELRRLLDETAKRRAELQIANDRIGAEHDDLVNRYESFWTSVLGCSFLFVVFCLYLVEN